MHDVVLRVNDSSMRRVTQADYHNYLSFVMDEAVFVRTPNSLMTLARITQSVISQLKFSIQKRDIKAGADLRGADFAPIDLLIGAKFITVLLNMACGGGGGYVFTKTFNFRKKIILFCYI